MVDTAMLDTARETTATPRRPVALAIALFAAGWGFVVANGAYAWATRDGGGDLDGASALALAAAHPALNRLSTATAMVASLLMVAAAIGVKRLVGDRSRRLVAVAAPLTAVGYICYFGILANGSVTVVMAERGGPVAEFAAVLDQAQLEPAVFWIFPLFVVGNMVGTLLLAVALWRARAVAVWAAVALAAWTPLHITGLVVGSEWFEVAGATLQALALAAAGRRLLAPR